MTAPYTPYSPIPVATGVPEMPPLGNDTVTFTTMVRDPNGTPNDMGEIPVVPTPVPVENCRHRPIPATTPTQRETPEDLTDIGTQVWQTHAPVHPAVVALANTPNRGTDAKIVVGGITYQVLGGLAPVTDAEGAVLFYKILSKVQVG